MQWFSILLVAAFLAVHSAFAGASFQGLGDFDGGSFLSDAQAVSADGTVVVGRGTGASGFEAFRWTIESGLVSLGDLSGGSVHSEAYGASVSGDVIVGMSYSGNGVEAFRWVNGIGMIPLGDLPGGLFSSFANGVSADGSVVVGRGGNASFYFEAFRWTQGDGMVSLGDLPGGRLLSEAYGVSADGSTIVGYGYSADGQEAFRWTQSDGMVGLGSLTATNFYSVAKAANADGTVVVGTSRSSNGLDSEAFRWTSSGGMVGLGDLPGGSFSSEARGVSADGTVVVGNGTSASGNDAFIWDATNGMRSMASVLSSGGADLAGWVLVAATGISADGRTIVGWGVGPNGNEAWVATIDAAEPVTPSVTMEGVTLHSGTLSLRFTAPAGHYITLRYTDDLTQPFDNIVIIPILSGAPVQYDDATVGAATSRFYEVTLSGE